MLLAGPQFAWKMAPRGLLAPLPEGPDRAPRGYKLDLEKAEKVHFLLNDPGGILHFCTSLSLLLSEHLSHLLNCKLCEVL